MAQTPSLQKGVVKTRGRMVNGKLQPGMGLQGATVQVKDLSAVVSRNDGTFSFPVPTKTFTINAVRKAGYLLVDADATQKTYRYSSNPFCLVMETPEQHSDDILSSERKLRRMLERQLHERENEIESLKAQNKLTQNEYRDALQQLYAQQDNNTSLISKLASRYASIDYDQLNEEDCAINDYILSGQFDKADSILKRKGDFEHQFTKLQKEGQIIDQEATKVGQAQAVHQKDVEDFGRRCFAMFELCKMRYEADSAAYYLELRAKTDTMNMDWQYDVALFLSSTLADFNKAIVYCDKALNLSIKDYGEVCVEAVYCLRLKSYFYEEQALYENSLTCLHEALTIAKKTESLYAQLICYDDLAKLCINLERFTEAEEWLRKEEQLIIATNGENAIELADLYQVLANVLVHKGESGTAATYHEKALNMLKETYGEEHEKVAYCYHTLAQACISFNHYELALNYLEKELAIYKKSPDYNKLYIGLCYQMMGYAHCLNDNLTETQKCGEKAISMLNEVYGNGHPKLADSYLQLSLIYMKHKHYEEAEQNNKKALHIIEKTYGHNHPKVASCYNEIGSMYAMIKDYDHALEYFLESEKIQNDFYIGDTHTSKANTYALIGFIYAVKGDMEKANDYYKKVEHITNISENIPYAKQLKMLLDSADKIQKKMKE